MANNKALNLSISINDAKANNTLKELNAKFYKIKGSINKLTEGTQEWMDAQKEYVIIERARRESIATQKKFREELLKTIDAEEYQNQKIREFGDNISDAFVALKSGNLLAFRTAMYGVATSIRAATSAGLAFLATPIGLGIAAVAGIALATKKWWDYNIAVSDTIKLTEQLTGFDGQRLSQYRAEVQATANTFDKDFNEVLKSTNALSKQMGISQEEALALINQGFVRGADASGDFLKKVEEYPVQFRNAGYSAQDFIDIATQEVKGGVYDDKLVDALKEADLALKEMTATQTDALENAFGEKFATEIASGLKSGEISTKQAIESIIAQANEMGLNFQQKQQIVSDVFKGAGEDVGGFAEIVLQLNQSFNAQNKELNENEKATQRLADSNRDYEKALADLFDASQSGFPAMLVNIKAVTNEILGGVLAGIKQVVTSVEQLEASAKLKGQSDAVKEIVQNTKEFGTTATEEAEIQMEATTKNIQRLKKTIGDLGFFKSAKPYKAELAEQEAYLKELKLIAKGESTELNNYLESLKTPSIIPNGDNKEKQTGGGKAKGDGVEDEAKKRSEKEIAIREKVAEQLKKWAEDRALQDQLDKIDKEKRDEEEEILKLESKFAKLEEQAFGEKELLVNLEAEKLAQIEEIRDKYAASRVEKAIVEREKLNDLERRFADNSIAATQNLEEAKINAAFQGIDVLKSVFKSKSAIYKALFIAEKGMAAAEVFTNTAKSLAAITANTAIANTAAVAASPLTFGMPWVATNTATGLNQAAAVKINAAIQLGSIAGSAIQGFDKGGYTDMFGLGFKDSSGHEVAGVVHANEYVVPEIVRKDPEVPQILEYLENKRRQKLGLYADGGDVVGNGQSKNQNNSNTSFNNLSDNSFTEAIQLFVDTINAGIEAKVYFGFEAEQKRQEAQKKLDAIKSRAKIKK